MFVKKHAKEKKRQKYCIWRIRKTKNKNIAFNYFLFSLYDHFVLLHKKEKKKKKRVEIWYNVIDIIYT